MNPQTLNGSSESGDSSQALTHFMAGKQAVPIWHLDGPGASGAHGHRLCSSAALQLGEGSTSSQGRRPLISNSSDPTAGKAERNASAKTERFGFRGSLV